MQDIDYQLMNQNSSITNEIYYDTTHVLKNYRH